MKRHAVVISNPGETGAENYCAGVLKDVENYRSFLLTAIGGSWRESEIEEMSRPSVADVRLKLTSLSAFEYVLFVFSGHGWHSTDLDSTVIELRKGQEIDSARLRLAEARQTLILDCCRVKIAGVPEVIELREMLTKAASRFDPEECRRYYNKRILECSGELVVMYACSAGQFAGDDNQRGGIYSRSLLDASKDWANSSTVDTSLSYNVLSVAQAHAAAEPRVRRLRPNQSPHIEKPRTAPYYPFCVVA